MVIGPSYNNYGLDFVGFTDATQVGYYQQRLRAGYYPTGQCVQRLEMKIRPYNVEVTRSSVSATR
jgi:hypothetical protein